MMYKNLNLDHANITAYTKFGKIYQFVLKILSENKKVNSIKGHNSNLRKMTNNNPNLHLVDINGHTKFGQILSI